MPQMRVATPIGLGQIASAVPVPDTVQGIKQGYMAGEMIANRGVRDETAQQGLKQGRANTAATNIANMSARDLSRMDSLGRFAVEVNGLSDPHTRQALEARVRRFEGTPEGNEDAKEALQLFDTDPAAFKQSAAQAREYYNLTNGSSSEIRTFNQMTQGFDQTEIDNARRIRMGLAPRAVGSADQTIAASGGVAPVREVKRQLSGGTEQGKLEQQLALKPQIAAETSTAVADAEKEVAQEAQAGKLPQIDRLYQDLKAADLDLIYGKGEKLIPGFARSQAGVDLLAKQNRLVKMLEIGARGELKGQGEITESEGNAVAAAATLLGNLDISPTLARASLDDAMEILYRNAGQEFDPEKGKGKTKLNATDKEALKFIMANPNDPRINRMLQQNPKVRAEFNRLKKRSSEKPDLAQLSTEELFEIARA